jgi:hypothetical protein
VRKFWALVLTFTTRLSTAKYQDDQAAMVSACRVAAVLVFPSTKPHPRLKLIHLLLALGARPIDSSLTKVSAMLPKSLLAIAPTVIALFVMAAPCWAISTTVSPTNGDGTPRFTDSTSAPHTFTSGPGQTTTAFGSGTFSFGITTSQGSGLGYPNQSFYDRGSINSGFRDQDLSNPNFPHSQGLPQGFPNYQGFPNSGSPNSYAPNRLSPYWAR